MTSYRYLRGINTVGGAGNPDDPSRVPGVIDRDYHFNSQAFYTYAASRGHKVARIDFLWERIQDTPGGPLRGTGLAELQAAVQRAATAGMLVVLDMKNYGRRWVAGQQVALGAGISAAQFADVWAKLAAAFASQPAVTGYGLMNEPHDLPAGAWREASQAAVTAIRATGDTRTILVAGDAWGGAWGWAQNNGDPWITDPAANTLYEAHCYLDADRSGRYAKSYAAEDATDRSSGWGSLPARVVADLTNFLGWLQAHGQRGFIGEIGWPNGPDAAAWNAVGQLAYGLLNAAGVGATYWGAGEWLADSTKPGNWYSQDVYHRGDQSPQGQASIIEAPANLSVPTPFPAEQVTAAITAVQGWLTTRV